MMRFVVLLLCSLTATVAQGDFPLCEVCGCPTCEQGQFPVGNLNGLIPIPPGLEDESPEDFTQISCALLEFLGTDGQISPEICDEGFRWKPSFRAACDCPLLPGATAMPTSDLSISMAPTASPFPISTAAPTTFEDSLRYCLSDTQVNFGDPIFLDHTALFNQQVFSAEFDPNCSCNSNTNLVDVFLFLEESVFGDVSFDPTEVSLQVASIDHSVGFTCENLCSLCFDDACAIISSTQEQSASGRIRNFTLTELSAIIEGDEDFWEGIIADPGFAQNVSICATFVSGLEGEVCLDILDWNNLFPYSSEPQQHECEISVDGERCTACSALLPDEFFSFTSCIIADCTNVENGELIDTCTFGAAEPTGRFQFLKLLSMDADYLSDCSSFITDAPTPIIIESPQPTTAAPSPVSSPTTVERCRSLR